MPQKLVEIMKKSRSCINVVSNDNQSFKWAILSALHPSRNGQRVYPYKKFEHELNFSGISFPVEPSQVPQFEEQNNISIDIYTLQDEKISSLYKTMLRKSTHVNLLLIQLFNYSHYVWIKNLPCLLKSFKDSPKIIQSENINKESDIILQDMIKSDASRQILINDLQKPYSKKDVSTQTEISGIKALVKLYCAEKKKQEFHSSIYDNDSTEEEFVNEIDYDDSIEEEELVNERDYENWNDPNVLVDRLRFLHLIENKSSDNIQESKLIISELQKANYIL